MWRQKDVFSAIMWVKALSNKSWQKKSKIKGRGDSYFRERKGLLRQISATEEDFSVKREHLVMLSLLSFFFCVLAYDWKIGKKRSKVNSLPVTSNCNPNMMLVWVYTHPSRQGMPSAMPKILASFIMHENSEPLFLRSEDTFSEFVLS